MGILRPEFLLGLKDVTKPALGSTQQTSYFQRMQQQLGLHTILGRLLLSAITLVAVVSAVAWWSHIKVSNATASNTLQLSERLSISQQISVISNTLWKIENDFKAYMLVPDARLRKQILTTTDILINHANQLSQEPWVNKTEEVSQTARAFSEDSRRLHNNLDDIMAIRADPMKVFPSMPIMVNQMNPISAEFVNLINIALENEIESNDVKAQRKIRNLLQELRYSWLSKINTFRMLTASRVGIFLHSIESSIRDATYNISIHDQQIQRILTSLQVYEDRGLLDLEQSAALEMLHKLNNDWNASYQEVSDIIKLEDGWRRDTPIIQKTINPLFNELWTKTHSLESELEKRAVQDIHSTSAMADQVSNTLWLLVIAVVFVTIVITLLFESQIRRPIVRVARALKAEAEGEQYISLPESPIVEAMDLVTAFSHMREKIYARQEHLQAVLTYAADAIITTTLDGTIQSFNPAAEFLFSYKDIDIKGKSISLIVPDFHLLAPRSDGSEIESFALQSFGERLPVGINISKMQVGGKNLYLVMIADIRERQAMLEGIQAREQRLRSILDNTAEGIVTFDDNCRIETWNLAAERLFGWKEEEVYGSQFMQFIFSETDDNLCETVQNSGFNEFLGRDNEVVGRHKNGSHYPLSLKISAMTLDGKIKYTALIANISERKAMMENLRYLAEHDSLTHLHNRAYFNAELEQLALHAAKSTKDCALFYIDLDNFKYINDTLGHAAGDKLLVEVATMLNRRARGSDVVARLGGDEFVVLIADVDLQTIQSIAESYRNTLAEHDFHYEGRTVDVGCSIGVSIINRETTSPGEILSQADVACHLAKKAGRNRVHIFSNRDTRDVHTMSIDMGWSRRIRQSLENDRFVLAVQPIYHIQRREIESY